MPLFFFDVETNGSREADNIGSELASAVLVAEMALDLCLQVAREHIPGSADLVVHVRSGDGPTIYQASVKLFGDWM